LKKNTWFTALLTLIVLLTGISTSFADDSVFREMFRDAFYGGAAGTLVGAAIMAFTKKSANHLDYMGYGAAAGVLAGASYGLAQSLVTIHKGKVKISLPTIIPELVETTSSKPSVICWRATLLKGTFD
jgi:hypothetical protein